MLELLQRIDALQRRVDELEGRERQKKSASQGAASKQEAKPKAKPVSAPTEAPPYSARLRAPEPMGNEYTTDEALRSDLPGQRRRAAAAANLLPPEPMGNQYLTEDALRSDLPGLSFRVPGTQSEVRFYGFANVNAYRDFDARNQNDAPPPQTIPLANSPAARQGGDLGFSARFSRFGLDTRTPTDWGTLETRLEGDFGGGDPGSLNQLFRLRLAWGELGTEQFRVLVGQANSLWNEGVYETVNFATNLNQSFVRQPQIRATASLAQGLTGYVSLEFPETQFTSADGIFTPTSLALSPAFNAAPDLLARLDYRNDGMVLDLRTLFRDLSMRTEGTILEPPAVTRDALGWGVAGTARLPMRWLAPAFGPDELIGMAYYGQGIGRYFGGNTFGQDALSNIGLPAIAGVTFDPLTTYGATAAYRRFWTTQLRSNFVYSYAWQDYSGYALLFTPGTRAATLLNSDIQQAVVNLIWSPFAELNGNSVGTGWLDVGLEYVYTDRDVFGGSEATGAAGSGYGVANRIYGSVTMRW